jgi:hypothetical protein
MVQAHPSTTGSSQGLVWKRKSSSCAMPIEDVVSNYANDFP